MKKLLVLLLAMMTMVVLPSFAQEVNMSRYITLTVKKGEEIKLNFIAEKENTTVRIVSGNNTKDIKVGKEWFVKETGSNDYYAFTSDGPTINVYGDIIGFYCGFNSEKLTSLDVSKNTELTFLICYNNQLTTLDISKNTELEVLSCDDNQLTTLDVSKNTLLTVLGCQDNQLTTLDLSKNTKLILLACDDNQLTTLDLSKNTELTALGCAFNQLTTLDLSKNTKLTHIKCASNQLTTLDVSKNTLLTVLGCQDNQLTTLDLSKNTLLTGLSCQDNKLTTLDVSKNTQLTHLYCFSNSFTTEAINKIYCDLPEVKKGEVYPINKEVDENHSTIIAGTSDIARKKGWKVIYWNNNSQEKEDIPSKGNYKCK